MSSHLRLVWSERIKREQEALSSMGPIKPYPDGFVFSPPLFRSGLTKGQTITINHPDMGGISVDGEVVGEIPQTGVIMVQLPGVDGVVEVPLDMVEA